MFCISIYLGLLVLQNSSRTIFMPRYIYIYVETVGNNNSIPSFDLDESSSAEEAWTPMIGGLPHPPANNGSYISCLTRLSSTPGLAAGAIPISTFCLKLHPFSSSLCFPFFNPFSFSLFFSILSSPLPLLLGLAVIRCQDDAFKTIKKRSARFPLPEIYRLWETVLHLVVCGRK